MVGFRGTYGVANPSPLFLSYSDLQVLQEVLV